MSIDDESARSAVILLAGGVAYALIFGVGGIFARRHERKREQEKHNRR